MQSAPSLSSFMPRKLQQMAPTDCKLTDLILVTNCDPTQGKNGEITYLSVVVHGLKSGH